MAVLIALAVLTLDGHFLGLGQSSTAGSSGQTPRKPTNGQSATLTPQEKEAQKHYRIALEAVKNNDFATASDELKAASELTPKNALIWYNLAVVESKKGDSKLALDHLHKATSLGLPKTLQNDAEALEAKLSYAVRQTADSPSPGVSDRPVQNGAPSYDDTVHYLQERFNSRLVQTGRCTFSVGLNENYRTDVSLTDLSPHVSWRDNVNGEINCSGGAQCVQVNNRNGGDRWQFLIKPDADKSKMEKALLHLLDLCGVRPAKPDLF